MDNPLLSVFCITFKQADYIRQTIESILNQEVNFEYELIVANDGSPDDTSVIVQSIIKSHRKGVLIRYFEHPQNLGMHGNFIFALGQCRGKYVAICEGDDYWTDPYKLQKQVNFLEANPEFEVCFTNIKVIRADGSTKKEQLIADGRKEVYEQNDLPIWAPTLTRVFRNRDFQDKLPNAPGLDTVMLLYQSQFGKIKFINEVTGVYRLHEGGIHSSKSMAEKKERMFLTLLTSLDLVPNYLLSKYFKMLCKKLVEIKRLDRDKYYDNLRLLKLYLRNNAQRINLIQKLKTKTVLLVISSPMIGMNALIDKRFKKLMTR